MCDFSLLVEKFSGQNHARVTNIYVFHVWTGPGCNTEELQTAIPEHGAVEEALKGEEEGDLARGDLPQQVLEHHLQKGGGG